MSNHRTFTKIITIMSITTLLSCLFGCASIFTKKPQEALNKYSYGLYNTTSFPEEKFEVERIGQDTCRILVASRLDRETLDIVMDTFEVNVALLDEIEKVVIEHKMYAYKERYTPFFHVLDGNRWGLEMNFGGNKYRSSGENAYPKDDGMGIIVEMVHEAIKNGKKKE